MAELRPAVFLDRDGVLNQPAAPSEYVTTPKDLHLLAGVPEALRLLAAAGYTLVVVSNQRGVALGRMSLADLAAVDAQLKLSLRQSSAPEPISYYCPHGFDECDCRKPKPGLILRASQELGLDLARSWLVGDSDSDLEAAAAAGVKALMVEPRADALLEAAQMIVASDVTSPA